MLLVAYVEGSRDPVPGAPAIVGYGARLDAENAQIRVRQLVVHYAPSSPTLEVLLYPDAVSDPAPYTVVWPGLAREPYTPYLNVTLNLA